ncbi:MAG: hypothetical protein EOO05_07630, partial [Chitinophagaceae bacterium]
MTASGQHKDFTKTSKETGSVNGTVIQTTTTTRTMGANSKTMAGPGCLNQTYFNHIRPAPGELLTLSGIQPTSSGIFIGAGTLTNTGGINEGILLKVAHDGSITVPTRIRINNQPTTIHAFNATYDGRLVIGGTINEGGTIKSFAALLNNDFSFAWSKVSTYNQPVTKVTIDYTHENTIVLAAQMGLNVALQQYTMAGTLQWTREIRITGMTDIAGFRNNHLFELMLVTNIELAGKKHLDYTTVDPATGNILDSYNNSTDLTERSARDVRNWSNHLFHAGIARQQNGDFKFYRSTQNQAYQVELTHTYTLPGTLGWDATAVVDNGGDFMAVSLPADGKLISITQLANFSSPVEHSNSYDVPIGSSVVGLARSPIDGGLLMALNKGAADEVILVKTDSSGQLPGCGNTILSLTSTSIINSQNSGTIPSYPTPSILFLPAAMTSGTAPLTQTSDCSQVSCPPTPPEDTCMTSFYKMYRSGSFGSYLGNIVQLTNKTFVVGSSMSDHTSDNSNIVSTGLKLFDEKGNLIRGITLFFDGLSTGAELIRQDGDHVLLITYQLVDGIPAMSVTKLDQDLNVIWVKTHKTGSAFASLDFNATDADGNIYFLQNDPGYFSTAKILVFKMDRNGNALWTKLYESNSQVITSLACVITGTSLVVLAPGERGYSTLRLDRNTGEVQSSLFHSTPGMNSTGRIISAGYMNNKIYSVSSNNTNGEVVM